MAAIVTRTHHAQKTHGPRGAKPRTPRRSQWLSRWVWVLFDAMIWFAAIHGAAWLHFDFESAPALVVGTLAFASAAAAAHLLVGAVLGPYAVGHKRGSFEETTDLGRTVLVTSSGLLVWALVTVPLMVPRSVPVVAGALALVGMFAARFFIRSWRSRRAATGNNQRRVVVFGAGDASRRLLRSMMGDQDSGFFPVALLDDDRAKQRLRIDGVRVRGTRKDIADVAQKFDATALVVALPQADAELIRELSDLATAAGLDVLVLPPLRDIIGGQPTSYDLRDVNLEDLLGRRPITMDTTVVAEQIAGRSVLVTGAGGSIGSEFARQIARFSPEKLYLLDRDESGLHTTQLSLTARDYSRATRSSSPTSATWTPCAPSFGPPCPTWSSTQPPSNTCHCWSPSRWRRSRPTCWAP
jgi:FlaA1/EpsC-like NDP-sugar epimerase